MLRKQHHVTSTTMMIVRGLVFLAAFSSSTYYIIHYYIFKVFLISTYHLIYLGCLAQIEILTNEPLGTSQPWNAAIHPLSPTNLIADYLKEKPLPTNAWWQNLSTTFLPYFFNAR